MLLTFGGCVGGKEDSPREDKTTIDVTGGVGGDGPADTGAGEGKPIDTSWLDTSASDSGKDTAPEPSYEYKGSADGYFHLNGFILYPLGRKVYDWTCDDAGSYDQGGDYDFRVDASQSPAADWSDRCQWDETLGSDDIHYVIEFLEQDTGTGNYIFCLSFDDEDDEMDNSWVQPHASTFELVLDSETGVMTGTCAEGGRCADNSGIEHDCTFSSAWRRPLDAGE